MSTTKPCLLRLRYALFAPLLLVTLTVHAKVFRWIDKDGTVHYSDAIPAGVSAERLPNVPDSEPSSLADLRILRAIDQASVQVSNRLGGPVQIILELSAQSNVNSTPRLPINTVLAAHESRTITTVRAASLDRPGEFEVNLRALPGDPHAILRDVAYSLPIDESHWQIGQGFHGSFSHNDDQNRYAIDLIVAEGTPVLCARAGTVMQIENGFTETGTDRKRLAARANLIRILHDDGSMAIYAHLREDGALVRPGEAVTTGQLIGYTGNTGFSSGPHLHFAVQINTGMRLESVPFRMVGPQGFLSLGNP